MNSLEKFFEEVFNESISLQEIFIKKDFIDVIDKAIQKNKDSSGFIKKNDVLTAIKNTANDFTKGERIDKHHVKRWLDFINGDPVYYVNAINYNNQKERESAQEKNAEQFKKWFNQGVPEMKELIAKHKDVHIAVDGTTDTIQGSINGKFIRDCFIVFLNTLAKNNPDTYKFIKPVSNVSVLR